MALLVPVLEQQLRRLCIKQPEKVPHTKIGRNRVFDLKDLEKVRKVCREAGYVEDTANAAS
jgi:hypothetical protein